MKVLIADKFEPEGLDALRALGLGVTYQPELKDAALAEALSATHADILVVRSTKVTDAILEAGQLSLVVRAGAGYDTIDVKSASRRGIYVSTCPGKNAVAVAELTFGLILSLDRRIQSSRRRRSESASSRSQRSKRSAAASGTSSRATARIAALRCAAGAPSR